MKRCAVSVDLDHVDEYHRIHGIPATGGTDELVYRLALARACDWAAELGIPLSLFAVGRDLEVGDNGERLARAVAGGHVAENHSYGHRYDLTRLGRERIAEDVERAQRVITQATGRAPRVFRAPGYSVNDDVLDALEELDIHRDASVFPCPPYYAAKALTLMSKRLAGRGSAAILDTPRVTLLPRSPYRPGRPWWRRGDRPLVELPMAVTRRLRLPFIGTSVTLGGPMIARRLARAVADLALCSFELHGVDFLDQHDGLELLARYQPDLRVPLTRKLAALTAAVQELRAAGYRFATLAES